MLSWLLIAAGRHPTGSGTVTDGPDGTLTRLGTYDSLKPGGFITPSDVRGDEVKGDPARVRSAGGGALAPHRLSRPTAQRPYARPVAYASHLIATFAAICVVLTGNANAATPLAIAQTGAVTKALGTAKTNCRPVHPGYVCRAGTKTAYVYDAGPKLCVSRISLEKAQSLCDVWCPPRGCWNTITRAAAVKVAESQGITDLLPGTVDAPPCATPGPLAQTPVGLTYDCEVITHWSRSLTVFFSLNAHVTAVFERVPGGFHLTSLQVSDLRCYGNGCP